MEKVLEFLEKTHRANWLLFTVCLTAVNTFVFYKINGELWNYSVGNNHPFFLFLEIALLSTGITRILVAINFLHWVQLCPIIADVINWCWWERRNNLHSFKNEVYFYFGEINQGVLEYLFQLKYHVGLKIYPDEEVHDTDYTKLDFTKSDRVDFFKSQNFIYLDKDDVLHIPVYIIRHLDILQNGFFLQKLWLKNGKFYAILSLIFAMVMVVI